MKYQLGISGEIVSFFLEFDHAWDAGKARERERERETGKPFFSPSPITASCLPGIPGSILRAQACRHGNTPGKLNIHRSSEIERQHLTILFHSAVQSVSEKFCVRKKKISMWKSFNFFAGSRPEPKVRNLNSPTPLMLLYLFGVMCSSFKIVVWRIFAAIFPPLMLYTIC